MTVEYILLMIVTFAIGLKFMASAPQAAFKESAPRLGARVEKHLATGTGFTIGGQGQIKWEPAPK